MSLRKTLEYYFQHGSHVIFDKYTIDTIGTVIHNSSGKTLKNQKLGKYNTCPVVDNGGKLCNISIGRAIASTFYGAPPTLKHTADHIDKDPNNDSLENIRWLCKKGQSTNRNMPKVFNTAFVIAKGDVEKTAREWAEHFKNNNNNNHLGHKYTAGMITNYAQKKQHGFSYKEYPDLPNEVWKIIPGSDNFKGHWEISNMNRVKYVTKHVENVLSGDCIGLMRGYPTIHVNGKHWGCHVLSFMTFFPDQYHMKQVNDYILHKNDDKLDFRPHNLRIGNRSENGIEAHENGCHSDTKTERMKCISYINGVLEKEYSSQTAAVRYLKSKGFDKASNSQVCAALKSFREGNVITRYGRTWETVK